MNAEMLETLGKIAGIDGICVGIALIVFHRVIGESILVTMSREHAYRLFRLVTVCVWTIALARIGAWVLTEAPGKNGESADKSSIETQGTNAPLSRAPAATSGSTSERAGKRESGEADESRLFGGFLNRLHVVTGGAEFLDQRSVGAFIGEEAHAPTAATSSPTETPPVPRRPSSGQDAERKAGRGGVFSSTEMTRCQGLSSTDNIKWGHER